MYENIFSPMNIGKLTIPNRIIASAAVTRLCNDDNTISEAFIRYQEDKIKGGYGLVITEDQPVCGSAVTFPNLPGIFDDRFEDGQRKLTQTIHAAGGLIAAQLYHPGGAAKPKFSHAAAKAPSAVRCPGYPDLPEELTKEEIREIIKAFGRAAKRAKEWGYDLIEIHAAHGYLIHQFLCGNTNKRSDEYGGSLINRNRFLMDVIAEVRANVGRDYPLQVRISAVDYVRGGVSIEESMVTARLAEDASADSIHCSTGTLQTGNTIMPVASADRALYVENAEKIKKAVSIPVVTVGRINEPILAENAVKSGRADFVTMFRSSLADPEWPNKLKEGRFEEINYCIGCMQGCTGSNRRLDRFTCLVRPLTGYAHECDIVPADEPERIAVVGGGVSGCEAAIYAAMRGHKVTIYEKSDRLGGRWIAASTPPGKSGYTMFLNWQSAMLKKYGVEIRLNCEATPGSVVKQAPDKIILALGGRDFVPPIPGIERANTVYAEDVLRSRSGFGDRVVVLGGGLVGAETADYIANYGGKTASIVEMQPEICSDGEPAPTGMLKESLARNHVSIYTSAAVREIGDDYVDFVQDGQAHRLPCDTVVLATGLRPRKDLVEQYAATGIPVTACGDTSSAKDGFKNIREGFNIGLSI